MTTALAKVPSTTLVIAYNETELAEGLALAKSIATDLDGLTVTDADEAAIVAEGIKPAKARYDHLEALRVEVKRPLDAKAKEVQTAFKTALDPLAAVLDTGRKLLATYALAQDAVKRKATEDAARAAEARDLPALTLAVQAAQEAAPAKVAGTSTTFRWIVKRVAEDLLPDEYWTPDRARLDALAKATPGAAEPSPIPGVVFERVAQVGIYK